MKGTFKKEHKIYYNIFIYTEYLHNNFRTNGNVRSLFIPGLHLRDRGLGGFLLLGAEVGETLPGCAVLKFAEFLGHF